MKNVLRPLLAVAALFLVTAATAYGQGKDAEVKQDQVKEAAREVEREGTVVDGKTGAPIAGLAVAILHRAGVPGDVLHRREAARPDLSANAYGHGRELFATFRSQAGDAESGALACAT